MATGRQLQTSVKAAAVTPSDSVDLTLACDALFVGTAGAVKINALDGTAVVFGNVPAGTHLWVGASRVFATGTGASNIVALYFQS